jgi:hypothetical protein
MGPPLQPPFTTKRALGRSFKGCALGPENQLRLKPDQDAGEGEHGGKGVVGVFDAMAFASLREA